MTAKSHITLTLIPVGVAFEFGLLPLHNIEFLIMAFAGTFIGAILPDIDEPRSYIGRKSLIISTILQDFGLKHRTYTHSLFFPLIIAIGGFFTPIFYFISFGAFMHIMEDFITNSGVPLLYPFRKKRFGIRLFDTGSIAEHLFVLFFVMAFVISVFLIFRTNLGLA